MLKYKFVHLTNIYITTRVSEKVNCYLAYTTSSIKKDFVKWEISKIKLEIGNLENAHITIGWSCRALRALNFYSNCHVLFIRDLPNKGKGWRIEAYPMTRNIIHRWDPFAN